MGVSSCKHFPEFQREWSGSGPFLEGSKPWPSSLSFVVQDVTAWLIPFLVGYGLSRDWLLSMWIMEWMSMSSVAFSGMHSKILMQAVEISWKESEGMKRVKIVKLQVAYGLSHQSRMLCGDSDASARITTWKPVWLSYQWVKNIQLSI